MTARLVVLTLVAAIAVTAGAPGCGYRGAGSGARREAEEEAQGDQVPQESGAGQGGAADGRLPLAARGAARSA